MDINNINRDRDTSGLGPIEYDQSKVPQLSRKYSSDIRSKTYGQEVRESIARGVEYAGLTANESQQYSQSIDQRQNEIEKQTEEFIREFTDKETASAPEIVAARSGFNTLEDRLDSDISNFDSIWNSPSIASIRPNDESNAWGNYQAGPTAFIGYYDRLMNDFPDYISKETYGKDQSKTFDWWVYKFTPKNYEKTIVITSGVHSTEKIGMFSLFKFMEMVSKDYANHPQLAYIRHKVRIIIAPLVNPWGLAYGNGRTNVNGVNINRNFDYYWSSAGGNGDVASGDYKGTAPNSEAETQHIVKLLEDYKEANVYLDFHNIGMPSQDDVLVYVPSGKPLNTEPLSHIIQYLREKYGSGIKVRLNELFTSAAANYASNRYNMHAFTPEFPIGRYGENSYSAREMTRALEWYGNIIVQYSKINTKASVKTNLEPLIQTGTFTNNVNKEILINNTNHGTYASIPDLDMRIKVDRAGIIYLSGTATIECADNSIIHTFRLTPKLGQENVSEARFLPSEIHTDWWEVSGVAGKRVTVPFNASIPVQFTNENELNDVISGLYVLFGNDGTAPTSLRLLNYRVQTTFIPTDNINKWQLYSGSSTEKGQIMDKIGGWNK